MQNTPLQDFAARLRAAPNPRAEIAAGLIGKRAMFEGTFGPRELHYADYVASGRALRQIEAFILEDVLPFYANSHTEASYCGARVTRMREEARDVIRTALHANAAEHAVIFAGSGATTALNKLVHLFGIRAARDAGRPVHVIVGPYEHHSNLLPWRESGATMHEAAEAPEGGPCKDALRKILATLPADALVIGAFSAASNVTGIGADVPGVSQIIKDAGGKVVWDYAGGGPYLPMRMSPEGVGIDAIALSPHKFIGGPGASGVLVIRRDAVATATPSLPGGGTVAFVNAHEQDYLTRLEDREEGGTPNIVGDIRAACVFIVKDVLGEDFFVQRNAELIARATAEIATMPGIRLLGGPRTDRLPILSFVAESPDGTPFDYALFTRAMSDIHGIQTRSGCACAGPYVHKLLKIGEGESQALRAEILAGDESHKPGFVRLNLSVLMDDAEVSLILDAIRTLSANWPDVIRAYQTGTLPPSLV